MNSTGSSLIRRLALASCLLTSLSACNTSQGPASEPIATSLRCPSVPADIVAESKRKPQIRGDTGVEIAGRLVNQIHAKNAALGRVIASQEECRKT